MLGENARHSSAERVVLTSRLLGTGEANATTTSTTGASLTILGPLDANDSLPLQITVAITSEALYPPTNAKNITTDTVLATVTQAGTKVNSSAGVFLTGRRIPVHALRKLFFLLGESFSTFQISIPNAPELPEGTAYACQYWDKAAKQWNRHGAYVFR